MKDLAFNFEFKLIGRSRIIHGDCFEVAWQDPGKQFPRYRHRPALWGEGIRFRPVTQAGEWEWRHLANSAEF
jgi:hypothetical protein